MPLESLPTEVWRSVIREATIPPGGIVTSWQHSPSRIQKLFRGWEDIELEDPEIQTKLSIVLVCQRWHALGIEFLYEWIRLKSTDQATALADVLRHSLIGTSANVATRGSETTSSEVSPKPKTYGWWVRRVDVAAELVEPDGMEVLYALLTQCLQVEIIIHTPPYARIILDDHDRGLTDIQVVRFQHSLRHLRLQLSTWV